ncbi:MAG: cyclic pyranopterin monophosphate synthase MoaC [Acidobacteria bacterium]|nr:MAG: cyclic pyranopterin monophosphate synthase MoaC [Acidobacteriota bacterium]
MKLTHLDESGHARMVDVSAKTAGRREARAVGRVFVSLQTIDLVRKAALPKGSPFEAARLAGVQAAKATSQIIPLCHNLPLDWVNMDIQLEESSFLVQADVVCRSATGVEMEALTAVSAAALTLYDMCKAVDKEMVIGEIRLVYKRKEES